MSDLNEIVMGRAYLFAVHARFAEALGDVAHKTEQDYLLRFLNLENKFNMLQLIVERMKNAVKSRKPAKGNNRPYYYFLIDLEAYFYLMISTLDIMAKLTPYFYSEGQGNKIPTKHFSWQVDFFKKEENSKKDPEYTEYLTNNMEWFEKVRGHRNELTHSGALYIFSTSKGKYYFGTKRKRIYSKCGS